MSNTIYKIKICASSLIFNYLIFIFLFTLELETCKLDTDKLKIEIDGINNNIAVILNNLLNTFFL